MDIEELKSTIVEIERGDYDQDCMELNPHWVAGIIKRVIAAEALVEAQKRLLNEVWDLDNDPTVRVFRAANDADEALAAYKEASK